MHMSKFQAHMHPEYLKPHKALVDCMSLNHVDSVARVVLTSRPRLKLLV